MEDNNCPVCFEALSSSNFIACANQHAIHFSCYQRLQKKECIFKCRGSYKHISLELAPEELERIARVIDWRLSKEERLGQQLIEAVQHDDLEKVREVVQAGANIEARDSRYQATPLFWAVTQQNFQIIRYLVESGADIHAVDRSNCNVFHELARLKLHFYNPEKSAEILDFFVEQKVDINARSRPNGTTAIFMAALFGNYDLFQQLWRRGADVTIKNVNDVSILHVLYGLPDEKVTQELLQMLLAAGLGIDAKEADGSAPLHWAANSGRPHLAKLLLEAGANPCATMEGGWTPLHYAAKRGCDATIQLLLLHGADPGAKDTEGNTPLDIALHGDNEAALALLQL